MFMSTTGDRSHIGNEWTHDKKINRKLILGQINETKHVISRPFGNSLDLRSVGDFYFFFFLFFCPHST